MTELLRAVRERDEVGKDLRAFRQSLRELEKRILESREGVRIHRLEEWVGTHASVGSLRMAVTQLEQLYRDYQERVLTLSLQTSEQKNEC